MTLTLRPILLSAHIEPSESLVIRHAHIDTHEDSGLPGLHMDSTDAEIFRYTSRQSANSRSFPASPPRIWVVCIREGRDRARLWSVLENRGETSNDGDFRTFDLVETEFLADLRNRLVIAWRSPRSWRISGTTAADYPVMEISDAHPESFPGFNQLTLDFTKLQAVMREHRYATWRTALASVIGVYLITDTRDGRQYIGKADGAENIRQRWAAYAANGHGGNVELRNLTPATFRFSLLRVFDPATSRQEVDQAENYFKVALDTRNHGLNRN